MVDGVPFEQTFNVIVEYPATLPAPPLLAISIPFSCSVIVTPEPARGFVHSILLISLL